jgi:hypothetical protein
MHVLLYVILCAAPALVLLPIWHLDREPSNEVTQIQEDEPRQDPDAELAVAARVPFSPLAAVRHNR